MKCFLQVDMRWIKKAYEKMYEKTLYEAIEGECGGDYKRMLLALVKP